jgi:hypothetical protein
LKVLNGKRQKHHCSDATQTNPSRKYSHTNPPYLEEAAALFIRESGIQHLIDLPSVDKEKDEGSC